jgi:hypothetical protein
VGNTNTTITEHIVNVAPMPNNDCTYIVVRKPSLHDLPILIPLKRGSSSPQRRSKRTSMSAPILGLPTRLAEGKTTLWTASTCHDAAHFGHVDLHVDMFLITWQSWHVLIQSDTSPSFIRLLASVSILENPDSGHGGWCSHIATSGKHEHHHNGTHRECRANA